MVYTRGSHSFKWGAELPLQSRYHDFWNEIPTGSTPSRRHRLFSVLIPSASGSDDILQEIRSRFLTVF